jgi:hypothetical protein
MVDYVISPVQVHSLVIILCPQCVLAFLPFASVPQKCVVVPMIIHHYQTKHHTHQIQTNLTHSGHNPKQNKAQICYSTVSRECTMTISKLG